VRFVDLAETSERVGATRSRREKVGLLAARLCELAPRELVAGVKMLSGELPKGRIGIGYAAVFGVTAEPASEASLSLREVDARLNEIATIAGAGSKGQREEALGGLMARATASEQRLLRGLLLGELRQGALQGVMLDAVARAFEVPAAALRRAFMLRGDLAEVADAARREGSAGLSRFRIELMRPLSPMLAQSAALGLAFFTAGAAALRLVGEAALGIALLILGGVDEIRSAVRTDDRLVFKGHWGTLLQ
jgi:DNA ligase-1